MFLQNNQRTNRVLPLDAGLLRPSPRLPLFRPAAGAAESRPAPPSEAGSGLHPEYFLPRCCHRGCVFPAQPDGNRECANHRRQSLEATYFQSQQPTSLLLEHAKFALPDAEPDDTRVKDRRRLAAERVRFLLEDAA